MAPFTFNNDTATSSGATMYTITKDGLTQIALKGRVVATGNWTLANEAQRFPGSIPLDQPLGPVGAKSIVANPNGIFITHKFQHAEAEYHYWFDDEDLHMDVHITNYGDNNIECFGFEMLTCQFDSNTPKGIASGIAWESSYLSQPDAIKLMPPSYWIRTQASYLAGATYGFSFAPVDVGFNRCMWYWQPTFKDTYSSRWVTFIVQKTIPAHGSTRVGMVIRVSTNTDWKHLLQPHKDALQAAHGGVQYDADDRPIVRFASADVANVRRDNPWGYNDAGGTTFFRRFDRPQGIRAFVDRVVPAAKKFGFSGTIMWDLGGYNPRGIEYPVDFHVFPPQVQANIPALVADYKQAGQRLGALARPGGVAVRLTWEKDIIMTFNIATPDTLAEIWRRFKTLLDQGFDMFYIDTFGLNVSDCITMKYLRQQMGRSPLTFIEQSNEWTLPYSGIYTEVWGKTGDYGIYPIGTQMDVLRWLVPGTSAIIADKTDRPLAEQIDWAYQNKYSIIVEDYICNMSNNVLADRIPANNAMYLDEKNRWK